MVAVDHAFIVRQLIVIICKLPRWDRLHLEGVGLESEGLLFINTKYVLWRVVVSHPSRKNAGWMGLHSFVDGFTCTTRLGLSQEFAAGCQAGQSKHTEAHQQEAGGFRGSEDLEGFGGNRS